MFDGYVMLQWWKTNALLAFKTSFTLQTCFNTVVSFTASAHSVRCRCILVVFYTFIVHSLRNKTKYTLALSWHRVCVLFGKWSLIFSPTLSCPAFSGLWIFTPVRFCSTPSNFHPYKYCPSFSCHVFALSPVRKSHWLNVLQFRRMHLEAWTFFINTSLRPTSFFYPRRPHRWV